MSKSDHPSTTGIRITQHGQTDGTSDSEAMDIDLDDRPASDPSHQPNVLDQPVEAQKDEAHKEEEVIVDTKVASRAVPESEVTKAGNSEDAFTPLLLCREGKTCRIFASLLPVVVLTQTLAWSSSSSTAASSVTRPDRSIWPPAFGRNCCSNGSYHGRENQ